MKTLKTLFFICCVLLSFNTTAQQQVSIDETRMFDAQTINSNIYTHSVGLNASLNWRTWEDQYSCFIGIKSDIMFSLC